MQQFFIVRLEGQGDVEIKVINAATWAYIHSPRPKFREHSATEKAPEGVAFLADEPYIEVTSGSCENDRALQVEGTSYATIASAKRAIKAAGGTFGGQYDGCIY